MFMVPMVFIHMKQNHIKLKSTDIIKRINENNKLIGIGETGLDFYYTILLKPNK